VAVLPLLIGDAAPIGDIRGFYGEDFEIAAQFFPAAADLSKMRLRIASESPTIRHKKIGLALPSLLLSAARK